MKKSINAIIVMYNGAPVGTNEVAVSMIASALAQSGLVEDYDDITIVAKDTEALTQAAIRECTSDKPDVKIINLKKKDEDQLMEGAIIFLGTLFKESLKEGKETRNYGSFMKDLLINSHDEKVRRAIEVIATKQGSVSKGLFSEYYMTKGAIETIRDAHGTIVLLCVTENTSRDSLLNLRIVITKMLFPTAVERNIVTATMKKNTNRGINTLS